MGLEDDMLAIATRIIEKKILEKHEQYGNSLEKPALIFNDITDVQTLINVRLDDKLKRMEQLDENSHKYWSEIEEIIAYLMWKIQLKERSNPYYSNNTTNNAPETDRYFGIDGLGMFYRL